MANAQGSKPMNICLCSSRDNATMFLVHRLEPWAGVRPRSQTGKNLERVPDDRVSRGGGGERGGLVASNLDQSYHGVLLCTEVLSPHKPLYSSTLAFMSELCPDYGRNEAESFSAESYMHVCIIVSGT